MKKIIIIIIGVLILFSCKGETTIEPNEERQLTLLFPSGGESFKITDTINVSWKAKNIDWVNLKLSYNNGSTWSDTINKINGSLNEYKISDLETYSDSCLIKIEDYEDHNLFDTNSQPFMIKNEDKQLTLLHPLGGEIFQITDTIDVIWIAKNVDWINLKLSYDNGYTWLDYIIQIKGTHNEYKISNLQMYSDSCFIRIEDFMDHNLFDTNNQPFKIKYEFNLGYFPMYIGITWVYKSTYYDFSGSNSYYYRTEIVGKVRLNNNEYFHYKTIDSNGNESSIYRRFDSLTGQLLTYSENGDLPLPEQFSYAPGSYVLWGSPPVYFTVVERYTEFFGITTKSISYNYSSDQAGWDESYLLNIGFRSESYSDGTSGTSTILKGAVLNGSVYGDTTFVY